MRNEIYVENPIIMNNTINYKYMISGNWQDVFINIDKFYIEYNCDISKVPESIAIIPLLANLLPMAWVCDAKIVIPECDETFYNSIAEFKKGYCEMYPMLELKGQLEVKNIVKNSVESTKKVGAFFSGGVDAFNTLVCHFDEKPTLLTLWGADVKLTDTSGWEKVEKHLKETAKQFDVDYITIKSCFRQFLNEGRLSQLVAESGDGWWHGFQHGIGIICHAAPIAYIMGLETIYFASSFTAADKGKVTCASDPIIDNFVKFGCTSIVHDGYEFTRQMKVHNIVEYAKKSGKKIPLRVCWESTGGSNCCKCEKCWRTILGVYAEKANPKDYGFVYEDFSKLCHDIYKNHLLLKHNRDSRYLPIQSVLRKNYSANEINSELRWFYDIKINKLGEPKAVDYIFIFIKKVRNKIRGIIYGKK